MKVERRGDVLIFRAGSGQWYNQPHDQVWDMGEDVQPLPPAPWHVALEDAIGEAGLPPRSVVVDATAMSWLVGQDWKFLLDLARRLRGEEVRLFIVANKRILLAPALFGIEDLVRPSPSVEAALEEAHRPT